MNNRTAKENALTGAVEKRREGKLWLWSAIIYAIAEGTYCISQYFSADIDSHRHTIFYYIFQWLLNIVITIAVCFALSRFNSDKLWVLVIINLTVFFACYFLWIFIKYYLHNADVAWLTGNKKATFPVNKIIYYSWADIGNYILTVTAFYMLKFYVEYKRSSEQRILLATINKGMQLNLLKQQLNPHFYFNTLNNLYGLARRNSSKLSPALQQLQNIMEYVIVECNHSKVSLQKEIDFLKSYIALEQLRYEENTAIAVNIENKKNDYTILPLVLIQLVENAFKHGMKEKSEMNWMQVNMHTNNATLFFSVDNSCDCRQYAEGIGLSSIKHRLNLQYEGKYNMQINNADNKFSVSLELSLE